MNATVNPDLLRWERNRAGLTEESLARKLGTTAHNVAAWEQSGLVSLARLDKLAHVAHIPVGYLFLHTPPNEALPIRDFRTVGTNTVVDPSPELLDTVHDALRKQAWYRDYLIAEGVEPLKFVGSLRIDTPVSDAAQHVKSVLNWDAAASPGGSNRDLLKQKTDLVEKSGIIVMRNAIVGNHTGRHLSVDEFRGFVLCDDYAPLIFLNDADSAAAQVFTLAHEIVHVWIGETGISNLERTRPAPDNVERFCNAVAAEMLVPAVDLNDAVDGPPTRSLVRSLARRFNVSSLVILRRLSDSGRIDDGLYARLYADEVAGFEQHRGSGLLKHGGNFYATLRARLGRPFVAAVTASALDGSTPYRDAYRLLGVSSDEMVRRLASMTIGGGR